MAVIIGYFPALHQGYLDFFRKYPGEVYVLGKEFIQETPRLQRDLRAIDPKVMAQMLQVHKQPEPVAVLNSIEKISKLARQAVIMPDEDVSRDFARKYLADFEVRFIPTFLRWDRNITTKAFAVPPDRIVTNDQLNLEVLAVAEQEAVKSPDWWRQVGAVITRDNKVLIRAHNRPSKSDLLNVNIFGDPRSNFDAGENIELTTAMHGEAAAIAEAARLGMALDGASIYVTTFPCPVCAKSIAAAGIKKVYYATGYSLVDAEDILKAHKIELILVKTK